MNSYLIFVLLLCAAFIWLYVWKTNVFDFETKKPKAKVKKRYVKKNKKVKKQEQEI
tara:strand:- start:132 stop:299 length:168 start_codon:yes stop_codon:yes gene_type:complete